MKGTIAIFAALFAVAHCEPKLFEIADVDGDDHLSEKEFDAIFDHFDSNVDKKVDQYEFATGWDRDHWDSDRDNRVVFRVFDVNDDGFITDLPDLRHLFNVFDKDGNSQISSSEFSKGWDALFDD